MEERPYHDGRCARCVLAARVTGLLGDPDGAVAPALEPVAAAIAAAPQPYSALNWIRQSAAAAVLAEIASGSLALTHEALDAHPQARGADFVRHMLVAHAVLPARDDALVRLEAWVTARLSEVASPDQRRLLRSYATWRVLRRARHRAARAGRARTPTRHAKTCLLAAIAFVGFLEQRGRQLSNCSQADVDVWLAEGPPSATAVRDFVEWATERRLLKGVSVPPAPSRQGKALDDDTRWAIVERLLHDDTVELTDRVAGCLVLLYGQQLSRIVAITRDQLSVTDTVARLHLGVTHIEVPEPLRGLLARLASEGRRYTGVGSPPARPWLFPGLSPGRPLGAAHLGERLRRLGIATMAGRRAALVHLAARLPAAVLADLLGLTPSTAVRWVRAAGGDWTTYAAELVKNPVIADPVE